MKRITISIPDELGEAIEREAHRRRLPVSRVIRERLEQDRLKDGAARQIPFAAVGRSGRHDTARRVDEILESEWTSARDR